ncbi:MAG TPA: ABC transporter ATP-binding protein [Elusimicrobiales bacterium]|nr:ABC transporter ATP-binding protein [Elusimicrobiales bacterium]
MNDRVKNYIFTFGAFARTGLFRLAGLSIVGAVLEGLGLLLLVPIFQAAQQGGASPIKILFLTDFINSFADRNQALLAALTLFVAVSVAQEYLRRRVVLLSTALKTGFIRKLGDDLYEAFARARWSALLAKRKSDIANALGNELKMIDMGTQLLTQFVNTLPMVAIQLTLCAMISPQGTLAAVIIGGLFFIFMRPVNRRLGNFSETLNALLKDSLSDVFEHLNGIKEVKSYGAEQAHIENFSRKNKGTQESYVNFISLFTRSSFIYNSATMALLAVFFFIAVSVFSEPMVKLVILFIIFMRIWPVFCGYQMSAQMLMLMFPAWESFSASLEELKAAREEFAPAAQPRPLAFAQRLELKNVTFSYVSGQEKAIENVSVVIPANKNIAIAGQSGSGKSTLVDLILGLLSPDSGEILIDGVALTPQLLPAWRQTIGFVPQETFLFRGSIKANLLWAKPSATELELWQALEWAAADFVKEMPKGLDTELGDRGVRLSGGQRQRVALARAILRRPALLILDEATSSIDTENERKIQAALEQLRGKMTILTIAHRLSTIKTADAIFVLDKGRVAETGTFAELAARAGGRLAVMAGIE